VVAWLLACQPHAKQYPSGWLLWQLSDWVRVLPSTQQGWLVDCYTVNMPGFVVL